MNNSNKVSMRQRAIRDFSDLDYNKAKSITNKDGPKRLRWVD